MRKDRQTALKLRFSGKSYGEINKILGVPKSTLSGWLSKIIISDKYQERIKKLASEKSTTALIKRNKQQTKFAVKRALDIRKRAAKELMSLSKNDLLIMGIALYWAEGYKRPIIRNGREVTYHAVSITNSDSYLIKVFLKFLREYCNVPKEKIKASIRIFEHQNESLLLNWWQKETGIPMCNFKKTYYGISKSSMGKRPFNRLPYGMIQVVVADTALFHRIMGYIERIKKLV
ncbi:hypothetical protein KKH14_00735 [Patescibacteria group bacterium]|nr:hypothetical protein [Patescibacteria group bacterium]